MIPEGRAGTEGPLRLCVSLYRFPQTAEPWESNRTSGKKQSNQHRSVGEEGMSRGKNPELKLQKRKRLESHITHS